MEDHRATRCHEKLLLLQRKENAMSHSISYQLKHKKSFLACIDHPSSNANDSPAHSKRNRLHGCAHCTLHIYTVSLPSAHNADLRRDFSEGENACLGCMNRVQWCVGEL